MLKLPIFLSHNMSWMSCSTVGEYSAYLVLYLGGRYKVCGVYPGSQMFGLAFGLHGVAYFESYGSYSVAQSS